MLTSIDQILYPDDCEVVEVLPHNQRVFLIQKNASSALKNDARRLNHKIYNKDQLKDFESIDIYIRDPQDRYISGIHTFAYQLKKNSNVNLDETTLIWMASNYTFINRHYLPQFHWILNLSRFTNPDCKFVLHRFEDIGNIVGIHHHAGIPDMTLTQKSFIQENIKNLEFWVFLDQILRDCCGRSMTWQEIINHYNIIDPNPLTIISEKFNSLTKALNVLP